LRLAIAVVGAFAACPWFAAAQETDMPSPALRSLKPPVMLPDGREFKTWRRPMTFSRTIYEDGSSPAASDENPGTKARRSARIWPGPFGRPPKETAAVRLRPGE